MIDFSTNELVYLNNAVASHLNCVHDELRKIQLAASKCPVLAINRYQDIQQILLDTETGSNIILKLVPEMNPDKKTEEIEEIARDNKIKAAKAREDLEAQMLALNHARFN